MAANPHLIPLARKTSREQELMAEHMLWVTRALHYAPQTTRGDLNLLLRALQATSEERSLSQIQRDEIMEVLRRTGEDAHGLDPLSMVRAARSLSSCGSASNDAVGPQDGGPDAKVLLEAIKTLERRNRDLIARLQATAGSHQTATPQPPAPPAPLPPVRPLQDRPSWGRRLMRWLGKHPSEAAPTVFAAGGMRMEDLKTIVLTVHGQANAKSLYDVTADWSSEKLRARRVLRAWAEGDLKISQASDGPAECRFGGWLEHVDPPPGLERFVDDLRMWHGHWHLQVAHSSRIHTDAQKIEFARAAVAGGSDHEIAICSRKIDRLLMGMAKQAQEAALRQAA